MVGKKTFLFLLWLSTSDAKELVQPEKIILGKGTNHTVALLGLKRIAVANPKIIKVRTVPPHSFLITALSIGKTSLRAWYESNQEKHFSVSVVPLESQSESNHYSRGQVARVSLQFLELDESVGRSSGVQWPESLSFSLGQGASDQRVSGLSPSVSFSSALGFIQLLLKEGWARIVASPELYVRLGEQATFHSGGEFPITTGFDSFGRFQRRVEWKKYGLTAKVKPESSDQIHFQTDIQLDLSEVDSSFQMENIPSLTARNLTTKMDSVEGETVILSGLVRNTTHEENQSLPLLGDIPILGPLLFSRKNKSQKETELLMAVTIGITSKAQEGDVSSKFLNRFEERIAQ